MSVAVLIKQLSSSCRVGGWSVAWSSLRPVVSLLGSSRENRPFGQPQRSVCTTIRARTSFLAARTASWHDRSSEHRPFGWPERPVYTTVRASTSYLAARAASWHARASENRPFGRPERPVCMTVRARTSFLAARTVSLHDSSSEHRQFRRQSERKRRFQGRRKPPGLAQRKSGRVEKLSKPSVID